MGQMQPREAEGKRTEGEGSPHNTVNEKDRVGASFQGRQSVNPATGTGGKGNPGKPS